MSDRSEAIASSQSNDPHDSKKMETRALLVAAASAFGAGLLGAVYYTKRKQAKEAASLPPSEHTTPPPPQPLPQQQQPSAKGSHISSVAPPKMTPEEYMIAKREARFFALKTLGYGTLLALTGAGVLATAVGYWLDVRNFKEFSDKLQVIVPRQTSRLRRFLGGSELFEKPEELEEWDRAVKEDE